VSAARLAGTAAPETRSRPEEDHVSETTTTKPDAVEFLEQQHEQIRGMFADLRRADSQQKAELFQCLVRLLAVHETAEEMVIHPAARRAEAGNDIVQQRLEEENAAKQMLADLEERGVDDAEFSARLAAFETAVRDHSSHEEQHEFPLLHELHDEEALRKMTTMVKVAEGIAPTHPHPHGPDGALGNLAVGPFVSLVDRVKDALRDRS
jgi:hemerythrin superfamily protein